MLKGIEEGQYKKRPDVRVGDTVKLHMKIKEGSKERVQVFEGVVIAIKGSGINRNMTVRKISYSVGVEKIVPFHAPTLEKIEVVKRGSVRRSKLYYLRDRVGKKALKVGTTSDVYLTDEKEKAPIKKKVKKKEVKKVKEVKKEKVKKEEVASK